MTRRIVFFDIDGTIMAWDKHIPVSAEEAIRALRENGHLAVVNTGRPGGHIDERVRAIGFDGFVCSCGAHIELGGEIVRHVSHSAAECRELVALTRRCHMSPIYESEEGVFFDPALPLARDNAAERAYFRARGFDVERDIDAPGFVFDKFCAFELEGSDRASFVRGVEPYFDVIGREHQMLEMVSKGCSKAGGIALLCERAGVAAADCCAVGDGWNDVPMFRAVGHSAVMGDGDPGVFGEADFVTAPLDGDGLRRALERFGVI